MPYPIHRKLCVAVSSSALFDLAESDRVFREKGPKGYKQYQQDNLDKTLGKGVAFPFIRRFLNINKRFPDECPVEVVLLSRNSAATGKRVFRSILAHGLDITRAAFMAGESPYPYIPAFNASLFLSANEDDVLGAIEAGYPGGRVLPTTIDEDEGEELLIAFDFDSVLADDESEKINKSEGLEKFHQHESLKADIPHKPGPLADLFKKVSIMQMLEDRALEKDRSYTRIIQTAIVTARNAPSHERVINTLESWGVSPNQTFFLGGVEKQRILKILKPHIYFDDQKTHLDFDAGNIPMVHIPFGIANRRVEQADAEAPSAPVPIAGAEASHQ